MPSRQFSHKPLSLARGRPGKHGIKKGVPWADGEANILLPGDEVIGEASIIKWGKAVGGGV